jgi:hypothetical protein
LPCGPFATTTDPLTTATSVGVACTGHTRAVVAREEKGEQRGAGQRQPDGGHGQRPAHALGLEAKRRSGRFDQLVPGLVATVGLFRERRAHHLVQSWRRRRRFLQMREQRRRLGVALERRLAGHAVVEQAASE